VTRAESSETSRTAQRRRDGLYLLGLGCLVFVLLGLVIERASPTSMVDFKMQFYAARCLLQHADPYVEANVLQVYRAGGEMGPNEFIRGREVIIRYDYLPNLFTFIAPMALLPIGVASFLIVAANVAGLIIAAYLVWSLGADYAPILSGALIGLMLANSELIVSAGNVAGIAISLCAVFVWCMVRGKQSALGVVCMAVSLALKPHLVGMVWLYFVLTGGAQRKRALQALALTVVLGLPGVIWVSIVAPHWIQELHANLLTYSMRGGLNDPGPNSGGAHRLAMMVNLQTAVSFIWDDPRFYNPVTYAICGSLLAAWAWASIHWRRAKDRLWPALAAVSALAMLPIYHRTLDTKLLLLMVPACALLWARGGTIGKAGAVLTVTVFVLTGDMTWVVILTGIGHLPLPNSGLPGELMNAVQILPTPLSLLAAGCFYLWVFMRGSTEHAAGVNSSSQEADQIA